MKEPKSTVRRPARRLSREFKRRVVEQSLAADVTVAIVARENGIREGLLWSWRREYDAGKFATSTEQVDFLPVGIQAPADQEPHVIHKTSHRSRPIV